MPAGIIGVSPCVSGGICIGGQVSGGVIGKGALVSFLVGAPYQTVQAVVFIGFFTAQGVGFPGQVSISIIGKLFSASPCIRDGN